MSALGPEWNEVFREPLDAARASEVIGLLAYAAPGSRRRSSVVLQAPYLGHDAVGDTLQALGSDVADQPARLGEPGRINLAFRRHDVDQAVDRAPKVFVLQVLQLVRQQDDQHVLMRGQYARDLGIRFHSCALLPSTVAVVTRGTGAAHRNRRAIFSRRQTGGWARTAFAVTSVGIEALYRVLGRLGDLVAAAGAKISRGAA